MVRSRELARAGEQQAWIDGIAAIFGVTPAADAAAPASEARDTLPGDAREQHA
jgi:glutamyl-tRNA reductase